MRVPVVVLCGRPNVGKSSLFNALIKRRVAIVDPTAGVTRDRVTAEIERYGGKFLLVDTGGLGLFDEIELKKEVERQIEVALELADVVLFVVDAKDGPLPFDAEIARKLRKLDKPIMLVANKADGPSAERAAAQFGRLGLGDPIAVSSLEKLNVEGLCEDLVEKLKEMGFDHEESSRDEEPPIKIAIVGKVNSGKSTFVNRIVGEERVIVSSVPGTTRDAVDAPFEYGGRKFVAIDTAGLRKRRVVEGTPDFYGTGRATEAMRRCDVVLLFVDAEREVSQIDKSLATLVAESGKPVVIAVSKWDLAKQARRNEEEFEPYLAQQIPWLEFAPVVHLSVMANQNVEKLLDTVVEVHEQSGFRVPTAQLNKVLENAFAMEKPRVGRGKFPKVMYVTQTGIRPPTFIVFVNEKKLFGDEWARFFANRMREAFPFSQVPLKVFFRERKRSTNPRGGGGDSIEE